MAENSISQFQQAIRLKNLAQSKFNSSKLKSALNYATKAHNLHPNLPGLDEMLAAFRILNSAKNATKTPELYDILGVTPFCSLSIIKAQYKKLALLLHPDKNTLKAASDEAFKVVNDAFQVLSDRGRRRGYDTKLRLALLEEREGEDGRELFWSRCGRCRVRCRFDREYVGRKLVCGECGHGFVAVEVGDNESEGGGGEEVEDWEMSSLSELVGRGRGRGRKRKMSSVSEVLEREESMRGEMSVVEEKGKKGDRKRGKRGVVEGNEVERGSGELVEGVERSRSGKRKEGRSGGVGELKSVNEVREGEVPVVEETGKREGRKRRKRGVMEGDEVKKGRIDARGSEGVVEEVERLRSGKRKQGRSGCVAESKSVNEVREEEELMRGEVPTIEEGREIDIRKEGQRGVVEGLEIERSRNDGRERRRGSRVVVEEVEKSKSGERKRGRNAAMEESESVSEVVVREEPVRDDVPIVEERRLVYTRRSKNEGKMVGKSGFVEEEGEKELTLAELQMRALKKGKGKSDKKIVKIREEVEEHVEVKKMRRMLADRGDLEVMAVEDSDFYDFDRDRVERSFKKGQVWAIYDDDDGMPRHYGLIDEVVSVNPFEVKMSWFDVQNDGNESLICREKMGFHVFCGRFKVSRKDTVKLLNIFSHLVECERAARELYQIYPKKGSVWALYSEGALDLEGRNNFGRDQRRYDVVVCLTTYSEMHGLSMAYLEKVDGYRVVFKRREIGYHAVKWLEKDDVRLFSHQIPARKLSGDQASEILGDCWELDPASLPPDLIAISYTE